MVMDATTGRPARERVSGELTLEKAFGKYHVRHVLGGSEFRP